MLLNGINLILTYPHPMARARQRRRAGGAHATATPSGDARAVRRSAFSIEYCTLHITRLLLCSPASSLLSCAPNIREHGTAPERRREDGNVSNKYSSLTQHRQVTFSRPRHAGPLRDELSRDADGEVFRVGREQGRGGEDVIRKSWD